MDEFNSKPIDNLVKFGHDFQSKCIGCLITDQSFVERVYDIIEPDFFESDAPRWIVREIIDYFIKYNAIPTPDVFKINADRIDNQPLKVGVYDALRSIYSIKNISDFKFIKEEFLKFCKNQKMSRAILNSVPLLENGNYDKIYSIIKEALSAGKEKNIGHDYLNEIDLRMTESIRKTIKTNWPLIDDLLDGGLSGGELGVVTACAGVGKSWILAKIGAEALKQGYSVLHISCELNELYVGKRYDSCFTGIDFRNIRNNVEIVREQLSKISKANGHLFIKFFPTGTVSVTDIKMHIELLKMRGINIDVLIVDYADILRSQLVGRNINTYIEAGNIYTELRGLAGELNIPVWTASQSTRSALNEDIIEADKLSDSYKKAQIADFIMSLSRKIEDKVNNTGRIHVIKNRLGPDGMTFPSKINTNCGKIELFDMRTPEGIALMNGMINSATEFRDIMKSRLKPKDTE